MKSGLTLVELAQKIEANATAKRDFVVDTSEGVRLEIPEENKGVLMRIGDHEPRQINTLAHGQLCQHIGIGTKYYDRMRREAPHLLATNVNHWFKNAPSKRLIRTLNGTARAFLSNGYKPLENEDLANAVLPVLLNMDLEIMSCQITERRLYIKAVHKQLFRDVPSGKRMGDGGHTIFDTCAPAVTISNSEVGAGQLSVESGVYTKACTNMATWSADGMKRRHVGVRHELTDNLQHLLSDETKRRTDEAIWLQVRDVVQGVFDETKFDARCKRLANMRDDRIEGDPVEAVNMTTKRFGLTEGEGTSILRNLIEGGDLTRYGLFNAVTRSAQDHDDYDRATELECLGGKVVELPRSQWREIAMAA